MSFLFGKPPDPLESVRKWKLELVSQNRTLEREIRAIDQEEMKTKVAIKQAIKRNDKESAKILSKEIYRSRKAKEKLYSSKVALHSVQMHLQHSMAVMRVAGCIQKSTEVTKALNQLVTLPQIGEVMRTMEAEMIKVGLVEEMIEEATTFEEEDTEEQADAEVDKILMELTESTFAKVGSVGTGVPRPSQKVASPKVATTTTSQQRAQRPLAM
eukprot:TRINITY_DN379_c0_g1_i1.p1 TRINITY_DN379_c0_g1~~TRINITY_DN379_c0_g1_i1.p1  ORF type:complete len:213 (+),score=41.85 TRINITY_DN379_c0_g1_i1:41-679(+)